MESNEKIFRSKKQIFINNFIGGIAWAFGSVVGLAIIFAIIGYFLARVDFVPIVGNFFTNVIKNVAEKNQLPNQTQN